MHPITQLRKLRRVSQLELGLRARVSQRHLSCIETGRAQPTRATLIALLDALDAPLEARNAALLAAGFAPLFSALPLHAPELAPARAALEQLLHAKGSPPALVLDAEWTLVMANQGVVRLVECLGLTMPSAPNLLDWLLGPDGVRPLLLNEAEVCSEVFSRAERESHHVPALAERLKRLKPGLPSFTLPGQAPLLLTRLRSPRGELRLFSMFSTFGSPLDVTLASLRIEHLFPADARTAELLA